MEKNFDSIQDFFSAIEQTKYLVLRNFDNIGEKLQEMSDDIDILCESRIDFIKLSGAIQCTNKSDCHNYYVNVRNKRLRVDIRSYGDGYYDSLWEQDMIKRRAKKEFFYIMDEQDYAYSLLYHAILQKITFSDKYYMILKDLINLKTKNPIKCCVVLAMYMKKMGYKLVYPVDPFVTMNKSNCRIFSTVYKLLFPF